MIRIICAREERMKMAEKEIVELISLHESKVHLHVEKFSLNTNWRLQKDSCTTRRKERYRQNQAGREEK